jgi:hypothetical protein
VLKRLASWCGIDDVGDDVRAMDLIERFDLSRLPRAPIVFDPGNAPPLRLKSLRE